MRQARTTEANRSSSDAAAAGSAMGPGKLTRVEQIGHAANAAAWPGGPTVPRKSRHHSFDEYMGWLRELNKFDKEDAIARLRRLYYGKFAGPGKHFDEVIVTNNDDPPFKVPEISQATLNGLFSTDTISTPNGTIIDPTH